MLTLTLASFWQVFLMVLFIPLSILLCLIILIQKPKGGGLSGAFGGAGGGSQVFGGKSGDILTWITSGFFVAFLLISILLVKATKSDVMQGRTGTKQVDGQTDPHEGHDHEKDGGDVGDEKPLPDLGKPSAPAQTAPTEPRGEAQPAPTPPPAGENKPADGQEAPQPE